MTSLLDRPDTGFSGTAHPVLVGAVEIEAALDRMLAGATVPLGSGEHATALRTLERLGRRLEAVKLRLVAAADQAGAGQAAGFTGTEAWTARHTHTTPGAAAREVALATALQTGHGTTADALDAGLLSPAHAAVIVHAATSCPPGSATSSAPTSKRPWSPRPSGSTPTSSAATPDAPWPPSNPTNRSSTPTRTSSWPPRKKPPAPAAP